MVRKLVEWALNSPLIVLVLATGLIGCGVYSFAHINVEAYPDPAPAIIEVIAQWPGASAEEMERQVTIPLEVALAGMPGLKATHSKSLFGLSHVRNVFHYGNDYQQARQEVINRLQFANNLPAGVQPVLSPASPIGEIYRYTLKAPKDSLGRDAYTLNDLKALQDWLIEREFRRVPGVIDVTSSGGTIKRYEIQPDPERLKRFGISLQQLQNALANSNANVGGDYLVQGPTVKMIRCIGVIGGGRDPMEKAFSMSSPQEAARYLRSQEQVRLQQIRDIVITAINNVPIRIDDVVQGGPLPYRGAPSRQGVLVFHQTRLGRVSLDRAMDDEGTDWRREDEKIQGIILMRKGEQSLPTIGAVKAKVKELNQPGRLLPGVSLEAYYDREELVHLTTHTVVHNLVVGIVLVTVILLMFLSNVRSTLIVAINIPIALLFAFAALFLRGKSANLLSIGAVDFGIIVDSSVIMVENIYRNMAAGHFVELPLKQRILRFVSQIDKALFFSTAIMVCAFIPLFTMTGAEGELFGPMAQTYACALGGALLLALTLTPVLCLLCFRNLKPGKENILVRLLKTSYLRQLKICLNYPLATVAVMLGILVVTVLWPMAHLGREFMPELEEGNLWIRGIFPVHVSLDEVKGPIREAREMMSSPGYVLRDKSLHVLRLQRVPEAVRTKVRALKDRVFQGRDEFLAELGQVLSPSERETYQDMVWDSLYSPYPEVAAIMVQAGRPDDGTDPGGFNNVEFFVPLKPESAWPIVERRNGQRQRRTRHEIVDDLNAELSRKLPGIEWAFSQYIRDNVMEALSGVKGDNSVKIYGPDLNKLEDLAEKTKNELAQIHGLHDLGVYRIMGQSNLEFVVDREKCKRWGLSVADVNNVINSAVHGAPFTQMVEGEKTFDVSLRWPLAKRQDEATILDIPVDVTNNVVTQGSVPQTSQTGTIGPGTGTAPTGTSLPMPSLISSFVAPFNVFQPRLRLRDLVSPVDEFGQPNPGGSFTRPGGSIIYREQGKRFIAVKFSVREDRDLASAVEEVRQKTENLYPPPYQVELGGEFEQMKDAEGRLLIYIPASLGLIFLLLYFAFRNLLDVLVVFSNVLALAVGSVWALYLTGTNFSISAAVGLISLFGVAIMDGLLTVSYFNSLRAGGLPVREAILEGAALRVRPMTMTALTAVLGLLPAALSTAIGAQTQRPLAIVVVGGMLTTLLLTRYLMPVLYSFYGHREPPANSAQMAH